MTLLALTLAAALLPAQPHTFTFGGVNNEEFLLDGKPFQMRAGEIDPSRVPAPYWRHRIRMAKAMGLNTIAPYIFWNDHERVEGKFDFKTESRNIGQFFKICKEEGMWVYLRPGPYVCGEWDGGGLPSYLWKYPDTKFRAMGDPRYTEPVARYFHELVKVVKPHLMENGGNIMMIQIENEYGSYPKHDHSYIVWLKSLWTKEGINGPFSTSDGPSEGMLKDSVLPGAAVGLDSGSSEADWTVARKMNPGVPVFSGETYPGWLRHWGEGDWEPTDITNDLKFLMDGKKSFNLYLVHGGTNFGFNTGANHGGKGYEPDVTSYDYGCPISEQGLPTKEYFKYRELLQGYLPNEKLIDVPKPIPSMNIPPIEMKHLTDIWHLFAVRIRSVQPKMFEEMEQNQGLVRYTNTLTKNAKGKLKFGHLSDWATVFVDGKFIGSLDRRLGQKEIDLPAGSGQAERSLEILVEGMGRINYSGAMDTDQKGISEVKLNGELLSSWAASLYPLDEKFVANLGPELFSDRVSSNRRGQFFSGAFDLKSTADTFFDMRKYGRGAVWVNGHNLGRFWNIGPQFRLYCPALWLKKGSNTITVFDMEGTEAKSVEGFAAMR